MLPGSSFSRILSLLCKWSRYSFPHLSDNPAPPSSPHLQKKKLHCASSNSASNVHFCLACSFFHPPVQFSRLALHTSKLDSDICRSRKTFLTLYQLHSLPWARLWHRTYRADLYFYLHRSNNTQTKANIFLRQHGPSTGAKFFIWCLAEEMTICDHAACESWTEAVRFIPELQGSVCKKPGRILF